MSMTAQELRIIMEATIQGAEKSGADEYVLRGFQAIIRLIDDVEGLKKLASYAYDYGRYSDAWKVVDALYNYCYGEKEG
jgi:hypothetical protein